MKIIAQKSDFYLDDDFFHEVIRASYVDGLSMNVVLNTDGKLLIYNYNTIGAYSVQKIQDVPFPKLEQNHIMPLEDALEEIEKVNAKLEVYLNIIPVDVSIVDDASLKMLNEQNKRYIASLKEMFQKFPELNISLHSISRGLILAIQKEIPEKELGIFIYAGDLTPTDVHYYVFPTYMVDNEIFKELIEHEKAIFIYAADESDLAYLTEKYNSEKTTTEDSEMLQNLNFIVNQPILIQKLLGTP